MKRTIWLGLLLLAGCASDPPVAQAPVTRCEAVIRVLSNPNSAQGAIAAAMEIGRNYGCFGAPK